MWCDVCVIYHITYIKYVNVWFVILFACARIQRNSCRHNLCLSELQPNSKWLHL